MAEDRVHLALFKEDDINQAAEAISRLKTLGITDKEIAVISGVPFSDKILGRPMTWTSVPYMAIGGAVVGFLVSLVLSLGTPLLYPLRVGNQPLLPIPPTIVIAFELTMLGMLISTFLGVVIEMLTPSYGPKGYHPKVSDGQIGVLFEIAPELDKKVHSALKELGAELVHSSEVEE